jgi:hypothetical protein
LWAGVWRSYPPFYHENSFIIYEKILSGTVEFPPFFTPAAKVRVCVWNPLTTYMHVCVKVY